MKKQIVIVLSGRKQSGKTSTCNYIAAKMLNYQSEQMGTKARFTINPIGELDATIGGKVVPFPADELLKRGIKLYSFADPLKEFCINVWGATYEQCYGTDAQKDSIIPHLLWDNVPLENRPFTEQRANVSAGQLSPAYMNKYFVDRIYKTGPMTGRELMQWFGTDICRKLYHDIWAHGTYTKIKNEGYRLALVTDGRFPNEITLGGEVNAKTLRLLRAVKEDNHSSETALDNFPMEGYSAVLDNCTMTLKQQCDALDPIIDQWFAEAGILDERRFSPQVSA